MKNEKKYGKYGQIFKNMGGYMGNVGNMGNMGELGALQCSKKEFFTYLWLIFNFGPQKMAEYQKFSQISKQRLDNT